MAKALLIAEKPSQRRIIEAVYKKYRSSFCDEITFVEQRGHLVTLKLPDEICPEDKRGWESLPYVPEDHGGWQYKVIEEKKTGNFKTARERYATIKKELDTGGYDYVIHAGDPDQEGELLVNLVLTFAQNSLPVKRFWTNDMTEKAVLNALLNLRDEATDPVLINLLAAAYVRQHSDYRFGMNLSRAASLQMDGRAAVGRVKTPVLSIVCKREDAIKRFVPSTRYGIKAVYSDGVCGIMHDNGASMEKGENDNTVSLFESRQDADSVINTLKKEAVVTTYTEKTVKTKPPRLFKLSSIQVEAGKLGYSADTVLAAIQSLYDQGFLSYPRTGCDLLSSQEDFKAFLNSAAAVPELKPFISAITDDDIKRVKADKRWVDDEAIQNEGHTALRPTESSPCISALDSVEKDIYTAICRRFVSIFLPPLVQVKKYMEAEAGGNVFVSSAKLTVSNGYTDIYQTVLSSDMPHYTRGDVLSVASYETTEHRAVCPQRFTSADLIAACENPAKYLDDTSLRSLGKRFKIGTDATRTAIINTLIKKDGYLKIEKTKKKEYIVPTEKGAAIIQNLDGCAITKVDMTGFWEEKLDFVRHGKLSPDTLEDEMKLEVAQMVDEIKNRRMSKLPGSSPEAGTCPLCGLPVISGQKSFFCSGFRNGCTFGFPSGILGAVLTEKDFQVLINGGTIEKVLKKEGKQWEQRMKLDENYALTFVEEERLETEYSCPVCEKMLFKVKRGLLCSGYERNNKNSCRFFLPWEMAGKKLPEKCIDDLLAGKQTETIKGFLSKKGISFDAALAVKDKTVTYVFPEPVQTNLTCPVCRKKLLSGNYGYICPDHKKDSSGCVFSGIPKEICKKKISPETAQKLLDSGKTDEMDGFISKSGKKFSASLILENGKVSFDFNGATQPSIWNCPCCGYRMKESEKCIWCACGFRLYREMAGKKLPESTVQEILSSGSTSGPVYGFKSKKKKPFSARLYVDKKEKQVKFSFDN